MLVVVVAVICYSLLLLSLACIACFECSGVHVFGLIRSALALSSVFSAFADVEI